MHLRFTYLLVRYALVISSRTLPWDRAVVDKTRRSVPQGPPRFTASHTWLFRALALLLFSVHLVVVWKCKTPVIASNVVQLFCASLPASLCVYRAIRASQKQLRVLWFYLAAGFTVWFAAQACFLGELLWRHTPPRFPSFEDFLWFIFAFPMLAATAQSRSRLTTDWVSLLDVAQACVFFGTLYALVFSSPAFISVTWAYYIQTSALVLACGLRLSCTDSGVERRIFQNIGCFLLLNEIFSSLGYYLQQKGSSSGSWMDLCWTIPLLAYTALIAREHPLDSAAPARGIRVMPGFFKFLGGISVSGLSILSMCAAAVLESKHPRTGLTALLFVLLLFALRTSAREAQLHRAHGFVERSTHHDGLTGLFNRAGLIRHLDKHLAELPAASTRVAVLCIDVDRFKMINDSLGHACGDGVLTEIASRLSCLIRSDNVLARLDGDEFAVLMRAASETEAEELACRVVAEFRKPIHVQGRTLNLTVSVGTAVDAEGMVFGDLLRNADCAMHCAKRGGRDRYRAFSPGMYEEVTSALQLETSLRQALADRALSVAYQPIWSTADSRVVGFEALARWTHASLGSISPAHFIPVAEEAGLIVELGNQVLSASCAQVARWNHEFGTDYSVSVNVSARQLCEPDCLDYVLSVLAETGLSARNLILEITESVLMSGTKETEDRLVQARSHGIGIAIDDFGTGYSSLSYLLDLPFDRLKIDRKFITNFDTDSKREALVRTIIQLTRDLGKIVVAEGVEAQEERQALEALECHLLQGFLLSKPLAGDMMEAFLKEQRTASGRST